MLFGQQYYIFFFMKRNSIKKASTFKLQAERSKYQHYLDQIDKCTVVRRFPAHQQSIKESSEAFFDMCFNYKDDSPFVRGLNYDNRCFGFQHNDNMISYREFLGNVKAAYLIGDFNGFHQEQHQLIPDEDFGKGWFKIKWDNNLYKLEENSRIQLRLIDQKEKQWKIAPLSCRLVKGQFGIYRDERLKVNHAQKHRFSQLLSHTIDLQEMPLQKCLDFIEARSDVLQFFNTIIIKNLFTQKKSLAHKFSLTPQKSDLFDQVTSKLVQIGLKVVVQWNFTPCQVQQASIYQQLLGKQIGANQWQFDLTNHEVLAFYLSNISHYLKYFVVRGLHFTKVHNIYHADQGILTIKLINLLCERLHDDSITLASSKELIVGMSEPTIQGGLGFGYTYNFHESLSIVQQHQSLYEVVKQIQASSNCLSLSFNGIKSKDCLYMLFTMLIAKKGIFSRGDINEIKKQLIKVLKLRRQDELFQEESEVKKIDEDCIVIARGKTIIIFNFSNKQIKIQQKINVKSVLFNMTERDVIFEKDYFKITGQNCIVMQIDK